MDYLYNRIAQIMYPCNWDGDFRRCAQFRDTVCSDYTRNKHMQHVADVMDVIVQKKGCNAIAQAIFTCNVDGDFHICDKIHCPADAIKRHKKQVADVLSIVHDSALV